MDGVKTRQLLILDELNGRFLVDVELRESEIELVVNFEVREQLWADPPPFLYRCLGDRRTEDPEGAEIYLSGSVRSDGHSNFDFQHDECPKYFHGRAEAVRLGELLGRLYDFARETIGERWQG